MCKHVLNAQVAIRAPCCRKWFDCPECHRESADHPILQQFEMSFACKKCKKCFRKDTRDFDESDEYCPHCDNHFMIEGVIPQKEVRFEIEDFRKDAKGVIDERIRQRDPLKDLDVSKSADRLG